MKRLHGQSGAPDVGVRTDVPVDARDGTAGWKLEQASCMDRHKRVQERPGPSYLTSGNEQQRNKSLLVSKTDPAPGAI